MKRESPGTKLKQQSKPIDLCYLLVSTIVVIPLIFSSRTLDPNLSPRLLFWGVTMLTLSIIFLSKNKRNKPQFDFIRLIIFRAYFLYFLLSVFSLTQAINPAEGLYDITKTLLSFTLLIFATRIFIQTKNFISILVKSVIFSSIIATTIGLFQYFIIFQGNSSNDLLMALYGVKGLMAHKNQFAISLFLMLPFVLFGILNFKKWWWVLSLYSTAMILLNITILQTRSVWIATLVFIVIFTLLWIAIALKKKSINNSGLLKKVIIIAIIVFTVISGSYLVIKKSDMSKLIKYQISSIFDFQSDNNQGRLQMWGSTWDLAKDNLIFGVGAGNWKITVLPYYQQKYGSNFLNWRRPHNDFLWVLSEKGIFGLLFYLLLFLIIAIYSFKIIYQETDKDKLIFTALMISGIGAYFIIAFFTFPLERINHQIYFSLMMAGIISVYYKYPENPKQKSRKPILLYQVLAVIALALATIYSGILFRSEIYIKKIFQAQETHSFNKMIINTDKAFTKLTSLDNYSMPIHNYRGLANMKLNKHKQALADFELALKYSPYQVSVLKNLAIASSVMGDNKMAIGYFKQSLEIFPYYEAGLYNLSKVYYLEKDYSKAYLSLLKCRHNNTKTDYDSFMKEIKKRIDTATN